MNLVADESVDAPVVERLRVDGHSVLYVAEISPSILDDEVLARANADQCPLMTGDKDFGELVFRLHRVTLGVILVRLAGLSAHLKSAIVSDALRRHGNDMLHAFTVISPGMVRIRRDL
jgi:predicted nuclease of predicted toxin-antitoxin system